MIETIIWIYLGLVFLFTVLYSRSNFVWCEGWDLRTPFFVALFFPITMFFYFRYLYQQKKEKTR